MLALTTATMGWITGICLAAYLGCIVYAITAPQRQPDPQRGMAVGCLMIAAIPGVVLAILLTVGLVGGYQGLVRVLFYVTGVPALYVAGILIAQPIIRRRQNRNAWSAPAEEQSAATETPTSEPNRN